MVQALASMMKGCGHQAAGSFRARFKCALFGVGHNIQAEKTGQQALRFAHACWPDLPAPHTQAEKMRQRALREFVLAQALNHPNVVATYT